MGIIRVVALAVLLAAAGCRDEQKPVLSAEPLARHEVGIVLMHGRLGAPNHVAVLAYTLRTQGYLVETPDMPWSLFRGFSATVEEAMVEIDAVAERLRAQGARRIVAAGHSLGGAAALRYAATRQKVDGLLLIAAGWNPASDYWQRLVGESVGRARMAVETGRGDERGIYSYVTNDGKAAPALLHARGFLDFFRPDSPIAVPDSSRRSSRTIPALWLSATGDSRSYNEVAETAFRSLPRHRHSRYVMLTAGHNEAVVAGVVHIEPWLDWIRQ